jgi:hypothetical protein
MGPPALPMLAPLLMLEIALVQDFTVCAKTKQQKVPLSVSALTHLQAMDLMSVKHLGVC